MTPTLAGLFAHVIGPGIYRSQSKKSTKCGSLHWKYFINIITIEIAESTG